MIAMFKKIRKRILAAVAVAALAACCAITGLAGIYGTPANALPSGDISYAFGGSGSTELGKSNGIKRMLERIATRNMTGSVTGNYTYARAAAEYDGTPITASQFVSRVRFDSNLDWQMVYATKADYDYGTTKKGDIIVTLYLADTTTLDNQNVAHMNNWNASSAEENKNYAYPSTMYSSSYGRTQLVGTPYVATIGATTLTAGTQAGVWKTFTDTYGKFLAAPANMAYQENESAIVYNSALTANYENEAWGAANNNTLYGYGTKSGNTDWKYDKLWVPSCTELGWNTADGTAVNVTGIWSLDVTMRKGSYSSFTRSSANSVSFRGRNGVGNVSGPAAAASGYGIRPACHLNLRLLYEEFTGDTSHNNGGLYHDGAVDQNELTKLYSAVNSGTDGTYTTLKQAVEGNGGSLNAEEIKANNGGSNVTVTLGGRQWFVPYISKDRSGNLIATLWEANASAEKIKFNSGYYESGALVPKYPAAMYGSSYIRSYLNGTPYAVASGTPDTNGNIAVTSDSQLSLNYKGAQSEFWSGFLAGGLTDYLVTPKNVDWQVDPTIKGAAVGANGALSSSLVPGNWDWRDKETYYDWGDDYLWIPAAIEGVVNSGAEGVSTVWHADSAMVHPNSVDSWSRSANSTRNALLSFNYPGHQGCGYNSAPSYNEYSVRAALHFNLTKASGGDSSEYGIASLWSQTVEKSLATGTQQEFILPENWYAGTNGFGTSAASTAPYASYGAPSPKGKATIRNAFFQGEGFNKVNNLALSLGEGGAVERSESASGVASIGFDNGRLYVPKGADIKLRLNGFTIDRNLKQAVENGNVFLVEGKLEICDLSSNALGKITGANSLNAGGAIVVQNGGELILSGGNVTGNESAELGGAVCVTGENSKFIMSGGSLTGNRAASGGGVAVTDGATAEISGGLVNLNSSKKGGGIYADNGTVLINGGQILSNDAENGGGVTIENSSELTMGGGRVSANTATANGGGIYLAGSAATIRDGSIDNNVAVSGGGVYASGSDMTMDGGAIEHNIADTGNGGGAYIAESMTFTMNGGSVSHNSTENNTRASAGGILVGAGSKFVLNNGTIAYNSSVYGGALRIADMGERKITGIVEINGGVISDNSGVDGGAIHLNAANDNIMTEMLTVNGGLITRNSASDIGGAIAAHTASLVKITGGTISYNTAANAGGGVYGISVCKITISGGEIIYNEVTADIGNGGGVYFGGAAGGTLTVTDGKISHNTVQNNGGGIYAESIVLTISGGEISYNEAKYHDGGGICGVFTLNMSGGTVKNNVAGGYTGGINIFNNSVFNMTGGTISGNRGLNGANGAGGVGVWNGTVFNMEGGEISGNYSASYGGGVLIRDNRSGYANSVFNFKGGRIVENSAAINGGGVAIIRNVSATGFAEIHVWGGIISRNTHSGSGKANNLYLDGTAASNQVKINIEGTLRGDGATTYIGVTQAYAGVFTVNYRTHNPVNAVTYFFSDDMRYGVSMSGDEGILSSTIDRQTLVWQFREDGGAWQNIDTTRHTVEYTGNDFEVQATYNGSVIMSAPTSSSVSGWNGAGAFSAVGTYAYTLENAESGGVTFSNPTLIFEIAPAEVVWQIAAVRDIDGNAITAEWQDIGGNSMIFTGLTYSVRAVVGGESVTVDGAATMLTAGEYKFALKDAASGLYSGAELTFTIEKRILSVNWSFDGWSGNRYSGYTFGYDGTEHSPVFTVAGIDNDTVGQLKLHKEYSYGGGSFSAAAPVNAGSYVGRVVFDGDSRYKKYATGDSPSIMFVGEETRFTITPITLTAEWLQGNGATITGDINYTYNGKEQGLSAKLLPPREGDAVEAVIRYYLASGEPVEGTPSEPAEYLARVNLPDGCVNYVLYDNYSQAFTIFKAVISPKFFGNEDNGGQFAWVYNGKAQSPKVTVTGADGSALIEGVDFDLSGADNIDAGDWTLSVALRGTAASRYILEGVSREFKITKAAVEVVWAGYTLAGDGSDKVASGEMRGGAVSWTYDGLGHTVEATAEFLGVEAVIATGAAVTNVGSASVTASLGEYAKNFEFAATAQKKMTYTVEKFVIDNVVWERDGKINNSGDTPHYAHGTVTGAGPAFKVSATGADGAAIGFTDMAYSWTGSVDAGELLPENTVDGYRVTVALAGAYAQNYKFNSAISADADGLTSFIKFFVDPVYGADVLAEIVWYTYVDGVKTPLSAIDGNKFAFEYDGKKHEIFAWYYDDGGNWGAATDQFPDQAFNTVSTGDGVSAGVYSARLLPAAGYDFCGRLECAFEITKKVLTIEWAQGGEYVYAGSGVELIPHYAVKYGDEVLFEYAGGDTVHPDGELAAAGFTVQGAYNAGPHDARARIGNNYRLVNDTFAFEIKPFALTAEGGYKVAWSGTSLVYNGSAQQPEATVETPYDGTLKLRVLGGAAALGEHTAYAVIDGSGNYVLGDGLETFKTFNIVLKKVSAASVFWAYDADGTNVIAAGAVAEFTFAIDGDDPRKGLVQRPYAFFEEGGEKFALAVTGGAANAGSYVAFVADGYDFTGDGGETVGAPSCAFVIKPKTITGTWSNTAVTYNGSAQKAVFTVAGDGLTVPEREGVQAAVSVTSFTNAGEYTAQVRLGGSDGETAAYYRTNYIFDDGKGGTATVLQAGFTVSKFTVDGTHFEWSAKQNAEYTYGDDIAAPALTATTKTITLSDGSAVDITFAYTGFSEYAGVHTVTAAISSATANGADITQNFKLSVAALTYKINEKTVTVEWIWEGAESGENGAYSYAYNGLPRGPQAVLKAGNDYITDDAGENISLEVRDLGTTVGSYTAVVFAPDNYVFDDGKGGAVYTLSTDYKITQASVSIVWDANGGTISGGVVVWTYDGGAHAPKAYIKDENATDGKGGEVRVTGSATDAGAFTAYAESSTENYRVADGSDSIECRVEAAVVYIIWRANDDGTFDYEYAEGDELKPAAVLGRKDEGGNVTPIIVGGDYLFATVTGGASTVGNGYTATAVPDKKNYTFADDAKKTHEFNVVPKLLQGEGWEFEWISDTAPITGGEYAVYNYIYNGGAQAPVPSIAFGMLFVTDYYRVEEGGSLTPVTQNALVDAGTYRITAAPADGNYAVPADKRTVEVVISPMEVGVSWNAEGLVYKGGSINQKPTATYLDAGGNAVKLNVTVDGDHANAGEYDAVAAFVSATVNYVLKADTATTTYKIAPRSVPVSWDWTGWDEKAVTYDGKTHTPAATASLEYAFENDLKGGLTVKFTVTSGGKAATPRDAGSYVLTLTLSGAAAGNYELVDDSADFKIEKRSLTITAESLTVSYGSAAPSYSAVFAGWADGESENNFNLLNGAVKGSWISCVYNRRSQPGEYDIKLNRVWLENTLKNYKLTLGDGKLTVTAVEQTVIWRGELDDIGAYYDGVEYKPTAVYYRNGVTGAPTQLNVAYADYNELTGEYTLKNDPDFRAVNAGKYHVIATDDSGTTNLNNSGLTYEIHKREVAVNINSVREDGFGDVYKTNDEGVEGVHHKYLSWDYATDVQPVLGHNLGITLSCEFDFDAHGYAHAGSYRITGNWDRAAFGDNYEVIFAGDFADEKGDLTCGEYQISLAKISILKRDDIMSEGDFTFHIGNVGGGNWWYIRLGDYAVIDGVEQYVFIGSSGYKGRDNVKVEYSREAYRMDSADPTIPQTPAEETHWSTERAGIRDIGKYFMHFRITIPDHETLEGTWRVLILPENQIVRIIFTKPYETEYGKPVPEDLAQYLYKEGYITFDNIGIDSFNKRVTATVDDGFGGTVGAATGVGKYTINFAIDNEGSDIEYHIVHNTLQSLEETNVGAYRITPKRLYIEWGALEYEYDGELKAPSFEIAGWVTANNRIITPDQLRFVSEGSGYEYSAFKIYDNGADISVVVAARGNFKDVGGHMLRLIVESDNYTIKAPEDEAVISIVSAGTIDPPPTEPTDPATGLPQWLIYLLIAAGCVIALLIIIIVILANRKRKVQQAADDDGFFDDYEE